MIINLSIDNFKSISNIELSKLKTINIIAGRNGRGKTSILDAIFIANDLSSPDSMVKPILFRGGTPIINDDDLWNSYFNNYDTEKKISIKIQNSKGTKTSTDFSVEERSKNSTQNLNLFSSSAIDNAKLSLTSSGNGKVLKIKVADITNAKTSSPIMNVEQSINGTQISVNITNLNANYKAIKTTYITTSNTINTTNTINIIGELIKNKNKESIIKSMSLINAKIKDLEIVVINGQPQLFFDIGEDRLVDVPSMGEGTGKLLTIFAVSFYSKNGIILIDEIENGVHYSLMQKVIEILLDQAKTNNNQVFITTHSLDLINTISHMASEELLEGKDISFTRIGYSESKSKTITKMFSLEEVKLSTDENWEIR